MDQEKLNKIRSHASPLDTNLLWSQIEPSVRPRKRRYLFIYFFIGILLIGLSSFAYIFFQKEASQEELQTDKLIQLSNQQVINKSKSTAIAPEFNKEKEHKTIVSNSTLNHVSKRNTELGQPKLHEENASNANRAKRLSTIIQNPITHKSELENFEKLNQADIPEKKTAHIKSIHDKINDTEVSTINSKTPSIEPFTLIKIDGFSIPPLSAEKSDRFESKIDNNRKKKPLEFTFFAGTGLSGTINNFKAKPKTNTQFVNAVEESYANMMNYQFQSGLQILHRKGFYFKAQISNTNIINRIKINTTEIKPHPLYQDTALVRINGLSEISVHSGFVNQYKQSNYKAQWYNKHSMLNVKLGLGYQLRLKTVKIGLDASLGINILHLSQGKWINNDLRLIHMQDEDINYYKRNVGVNYAVSMQLEHPISRRTSIYIQPFFNNYFSSISSDHGNYDHAIKLFGLNVGTKLTLSGFNK